MGRSTLLFFSVGSIIGSGIFIAPGGVLKAGAGGGVIWLKSTTTGTN